VPAAAISDQQIHVCKVACERENNKIAMVVEVWLLELESREEMCCLL
jgi:hypothetical protein